MLGLATLLLLSTTAWLLSFASGLALGFHALNYVDNRISLTHDAFPSNAQVFTLLMPSFDPALGRRQTSPTITDIAQTSDVEDRRTRRPHFSRSTSTSTSTTHTSTSTSTSTDTQADTQAETTTSDQSQTPLPSDTQSASTTDSTPFITETTTIPPSISSTPSLSTFTPSVPVMNMQTGETSPSPSPPSATPTTSRSHTTAIIAGIVVPGSLIIVALFVIIYLLLRKRRNMRTAAYYRDMIVQNRLAEEKLAASHERLLEGMRRERERAQASTSAPVTRTLSRLNQGDGSPRTADSGRVSAFQQQATPSPGTALEVTETSSDNGSIVFAHPRPQSNQSLGPTPPSALSKATPTPIAESSDSGSILFFRPGLRSPSPPGSFLTSLTLKSVTVQKPSYVPAPPNRLSLPQTPPTVPEPSNTAPPEKLSKFWFVRGWKS